MQNYHSGEEVKLGDVVKWPDDEGEIVALQEDLPKWGLTQADAAGKAMIKFKRIGLVCEHTLNAEDLQLIRRGGA